MRMGLFLDWKRITRSERAHWSPRLAMAIRVAVLSRSGVWDGDSSMIRVLDTALTKQAKMC